MQDNLEGMTEDEILLALQTLEQQEKQLEDKVSRISQARPFDFWKPTDGSVTDQGRKFLEKWLRPEDIPVKFQGQIDVLTSDRSIIIDSSGNQAGKTEELAVLVPILMTGELPLELKGRFPEWKLPTAWPIYGRVYGGDTDSIQEVIIPKIRERFPERYMHKDGWESTYSKSEKVLRFFRDNQTFIGQVKFMTYEQDTKKQQGASLAWILFDEEPPMDKWKEAMARFLATKKKKPIVYIFATPTNGLSWITRLLVPRANKLDSDVALFKRSTITNPYANYNALEELLQSLDHYEERKIRLLGEYESLNGLVFSGDAAITEDHFVKPYEKDWNRDMIVSGMDVHLSKPTSIVSAAIDPSEQIVVCGAYSQTADSDQVKRDMALRAIERNWRWEWTVFDKSLDYNIPSMDNINIMDKYRNDPNAIPGMVPSDKSEGIVKAGYDTIKALIRKKQLKFEDTPEVRELVDQLRLLERDRANNEDKKGMRDKINDGPLDLAAAFRYIFQRPLFWLEPHSTRQPEPEESDRYI